MLLFFVATTFLRDYKMGVVCEVGLAHSRLGKRDRLAENKNVAGEVGTVPKAGAGKKVCLYIYVIKK